MLAASSMRVQPFRSAPAAAPCPRVRVQRCSTARVYASKGLQTFLEDCSKANLGKCRFIVLGDGAILEAVSTFSRVKYTDLPERGRLATISTEDKQFECHVTLAKITTVKMARSKAKSGEYDIYATRFVAEGGRVALSVILHGEPAGQYDPVAVQAWEQLHAKYGGSVPL